MTTPTEQQLRELFAAEAAAAPHDVDLAAGVLRRARHRRRSQLAALGALATAVLVVAGLVGAAVDGSGLRRPSPPAAAPQPSSSPAPPGADSSVPTGGGPLRGNTSADCVEAYSPKAAVTRRAFAFDGTVAAIGPAHSDGPGVPPPTVAVTFRVHTWFRGGAGPMVTVDMQPPTVLNPDSAVTSYRVGTRVLVAGDPRWGGAPLDAPIAWGCGFTRYYHARTAGEWAAASR